MRCVFSRSRNRLAAESLYLLGIHKTGLEEVWKGVEEFLDFIQANGYFTHNRNRQNKYWMYETIDEVLKNSFYHNPQIEPRITELEQKSARRQSQLVRRGARIAGALLQKQELNGPRSNRSCHTALNQTLNIT